MLWLTEDATDGPKPPANFEFDAAVLNKKFAGAHAPHRRSASSASAIRSTTAGLWSTAAWSRGCPAKAMRPQKAPAELVFRGNGVIVFLTTEK